MKLTLFNHFINILLQMSFGRILVIESAGQKPQCDVCGSFKTELEKQSIEVVSVTKQKAHQ